QRYVAGRGRSGICDDEIEIGVRSAGHRRSRSAGRDRDNVGTISDAWIRAAATAAAACAEQARNRENHRETKTHAIRVCVKSRILGLLHDARETIAHARLDTGMFCQVALGFIAPLISELGKLL